MVTINFFYECKDTLFFAIRRTSVRKEIPEPNLNGFDQIDLDNISVLYINIKEHFILKFVYFGMFHSYGKSRFSHRKNPSFLVNKKKLPKKGL